LVKEPIDALIELEVEDAFPDNPFRKILVCHHCYHKLRPDMWISKGCLEMIGCKTPFEKLPLAED